MVVRVSSFIGTITRVARIQPHFDKYLLLAVWIQQKTTVPVACLHFRWHMSTTWTFLDRSHLPDKSKFRTIYRRNSGRSQERLHAVWWERSLPASLKILIALQAMHWYLKQVAGWWREANTNCFGSTMNVIVPYWLTEFLVLVIIVFTQYDNLYNYIDLKLAINPSFKKMIEAKTGAYFAETVSWHDEST